MLALQPEEKNPRVWKVAGDLFRECPDMMVCHAIMRPTSVAGDELDGAPANEEEFGIVQRVRAQLTEHLGPAAVEVPIKILHGDPGQRICEYATYSKCDLVVIGTRGKRSIGKMLRGSVSRYVAGSFRGSVLLVGD
jgi:nucleotide-binding universal stress UspA family protein